MAGPVLAGAPQLTSRLSVVPAFADTVGAAGTPGGSTTSVTLMVTDVVASTVPSLTFTVTE